MPTKTKVHFARPMKDWVDTNLPDTIASRLLMENLKTHHLHALYEAFGPATGRRIARKLEIHYAPQHAIWLNVFAIEMAVLLKQRLERRLPFRDVLAQEVLAWDQCRNDSKTTVKK